MPPRSAGERWQRNCRWGRVVVMRRHRCRSCFRWSAVWTNPGRMPASHYTADPRQRTHYAPGAYPRYCLHCPQNEHRLMSATNKAAPGKTKGRESESVRSVERAVDVLFSFNQDQPVLDLPALQERTGLSRPTLYRLLRTLEAKGLIYSFGSPLRFQLGPRFGLLASRGHRHLRWWRWRPGRSNGFGRRRRRRWD